MKLGIWEGGWCVGDTWGAASKGLWGWGLVVGEVCDEVIEMKLGIKVSLVAVGISRVSKEVVGAVVKFGIWDAGLGFFGEAVSGIAWVAGSGIARDGMGVPDSNTGEAESWGGAVSPGRLAEITASDSGAVNATGIVVPDIEDPMGRPSL